MPRCGRNARPCRLRAERPTIPRWVRSCMPISVKFAAASESLTPLIGGVMMAATRVDRELGEGSDVAGQHVRERSGRCR